MYGGLDSDMALLESIRNFLLADDCHESPDTTHLLCNPGLSFSSSLFLKENWSDLLQAANFGLSSNLMTVKRETKEQATVVVEESASRGWVTGA